MIKLIAIDLDGTLFNSHQQISETNKKAIELVLESGIQTAIVTGRGRAGAMTAIDCWAWRCLSSVPLVR